MIPLPFEHGGLTYTVATWVAKTGQESFWWSDRWEGENPNPVAFAGAVVPADRAGLDLSPVLAAAMGQLLRRVWVLPTNGNIGRLLTEHLGEGGALEMGNPSPRPTVERLGRNFCAATGQVRLPSGAKISLHLLVDRDHSPEGIRSVLDGESHLKAQELT